MSNFPSVRPSLNLQFDSQPTPEDMTSHLASVGAIFSRASIGTYTDANGIIQEATSGQARPNYSTAGVHEGLLIEESRTNLVKSSEDFSTTDWDATAGGSVTINQIIAPDGKASADLLTSKAGGSNFDRVQQSVSLTSGNDVTFSLFVKQYESEDQVTIRLEGTSLGTAGTDTNSNYKFTFSTETISKISGGTAKSTFVENVGNGWYKIGITLDNATITNSAIYPKFNSADAGSVYIWGAQLEAGSFPTSYIPTIPTFTSRASDGTYFDSSGVLQTASTDVARIDHKYIDGEWVEAGLLLEGESVNYAKASEDLDNTTYWSVIATTVSTDTETDPEGGTNSYLLAETVNSGQHYLGIDASHRPSVTSGETWTYSIFVKKGDGANAPDIVQVATNAFFNDNLRANFNISSGTVTDSNLCDASIEQYGDWYRISVIMESASSGSGNVVLAFCNDNPTASRLPSYAGQTDADVFIWGAQLEEQSQATSYIKTVDSTATRSADVYTTATKERSADVCYIDGTAFSDFYNQEEGTVLVDAKLADGQGGAGGENYFFHIDDGTYNNRIEFDRTIFGTIRFRVTQSSTSYTETTSGTYADGSDVKVVFAFIDSSFRGYINGSDVAENTSVIMTSGLNKFSIGNNGPNGAAFFNGSIKKLIYFPRKLTPDTQLEKLTQ